MGDILMRTAVVSPVGNQIGVKTLTDLFLAYLVVRLLLKLVY